MDGEKFILTGLPTPPTHNKSYFPFLVRAKGKIVPRLAPSRELTAYKKAFAIYAQTHDRRMREIANGCKQWLLEGKQLNVHMQMVAPKSRFFTQKDSAKKIDISNRIKVLHDCLFDAISLDDSEVFYCSAEKLITSTEREYCIVHISPCSPRSMLEDM